MINVITEGLLDYFYPDQWKSHLNLLIEFWKINILPTQNSWMATLTVDVLKRYGVMFHSSLYTNQCFNNQQNSGLPDITAALQMMSNGKWSSDTECTLNNCRHAVGNVAHWTGALSLCCQIYKANNDFQLTVTLNWDTEMLLGWTLRRTHCLMSEAKRRGSNERSHFSFLVHLKGKKREERVIYRQYVHIHTLVTQLGLTPFHLLAPGKRRMSHASQEWDTFIIFPPEQKGAVVVSEQ